MRKVTSDFVTETTVTHYLRLRISIYWITNRPNSSLIAVVVDTITGKSKYNDACLAVVTVILLFTAFCHFCVNYRNTVLFMRCS